MATGRLEQRPDADSTGVRAALRGLPGAAAMARPLGILLAAFPVWLLSSLGLVPYGIASAWAGVALLAALLLPWALSGPGEVRAA